MIPFNPPALILVNNDLVPQVQSVFSRQLNLTEIISRAEFDARLANDPNYPTIIHLNNLRVMVLDDLSNLSNRSLFDIVLFAKAGLVTVEFNKFGPPNITLPIDRVYLTALFNLTIMQQQKCQCTPPRIMDNSLVFPNEGECITLDEIIDDNTDI